MLSIYISYYMVPHDIVPHPCSVNKGCHLSVLKQQDQVLALLNKLDYCSPVLMGNKILVQLSLHDSHTICASYIIISQHLHHRLV